MYHCGMRQMEEKHVASQVDLMVWSNRLDLLALSNNRGEVQVHRLHWQKIWSLPPQKENDMVRAMAWRPDGKALAIGYSSGLLCIVDIEDKDILHKFNLEDESSEEFEDQKSYGVTCIKWPVRAGSLESATEYNIYNDSSIFLTKPSSMNGNYKTPAVEDACKDLKDVQEQTQLNILMVGYGAGKIHMSIFGRFPFGTLSLAQLVNDECGEYKVLDIEFTDDFSLMQILYCERASEAVCAALVNTSALAAYADDIFTIANKHGQIVRMTSHLDQTMLSIAEAWEQILLEMDTKMSDYAASVPEGGVSADFLELLMMGTPTDELELFLLQELTAKGLKKFGSSVELSYSTIQKLVLRQLNVVGQSLTYYLAELRGLTRIPDRYKIMGLEESDVTEAIKASFAFLNKCLELQQVIDVSMRNYKAFFRWLFVVIVRLLDEQTPTEIVKITQQELSHIAEFLYTFYSEKTTPVASAGGGKPVRCNLERLGQYLQDRELVTLPDDDDHPWHTFLNENPCFAKDSDTIFYLPEFKKYSLVQQQHHLKAKIDKVFDVSQKDMCQNFYLAYNIKCVDDVTGANKIEGYRISQLYDAAQERFMVCFVNESNGKDGLSFMSISTKEHDCSGSAIKYYFSKSLIPGNGDHSDPSGHLEVFDLQFYSTDYISVLVSHPHNSDSTIYIQLPIKIAIDNCNEFNIRSKSSVFNERTSRRDLSPLLDAGACKPLEALEGRRLAVSGGRKVGVVLARSRRKVRVFEMEADADDEPEADSSHHTARSDSPPADKTA